METGISKLKSRFFVVGVGKTIFSGSFFYILLILGGEKHKQVMLCITYLTSVCLSFFTQRNFVWKSEMPLSHEFLRFSGIACFCYVLNATVLEVLTNLFNVKVFLIQLPIAALLAIVSFLLQKSIVFTGKKSL
jgi:putative flippase GtrA